MQPSELLTHFLETLHAAYAQCVGELTDEQLHWRHSEDTVSIAFHMWHYARTKDNIINFVCQERKRPVWLRQGLDEAWGLPRVDQGTDMANVEALALRVPGVEALLQYANDVHADVLPYVRDSGDAELASTVRVVQFGHLAKSQQIMQTCIAHGNTHLGSVITMRALMGISSPGF